MKTNLVLKGIEFNGIKIGEVSITQDYSVTEAIRLASAGKSFVQELLKELPEMIDNIIACEKKILNRDSENEMDLVDKYMIALEKETNIYEIDKILEEAHANKSLSLSDFSNFIEIASKKVAEYYK